MCFDDNKHYKMCKCAKQIVKCVTIIRKRLEYLMGCQDWLRA